MGGQCFFYATNISQLLEIGVHFLITKHRKKHTMFPAIFIGGIGLGQKNQAFKAIGQMPFYALGTKFTIHSEIRSVPAPMEHFLVFHIDSVGGNAGLLVDQLAHVRCHLIIRRIASLSDVIGAAHN